MKKAIAEQKEEEDAVGFNAKVMVISQLRQLAMIRDNDREGVDEQQVFPSQRHLRLQAGGLVPQLLPMMTMGNCDSALPLLFPQKTGEVPCTTQGLHRRIHHHPRHDSRGRASRANERSLLPIPLHPPPPSSYYNCFSTHHGLQEANRPAFPVPSEEDLTLPSLFLHRYPRARRPSTTTCPTTIVILFITIVQDDSCGRL